MSASPFCSGDSASSPHSPRHFPSCSVGCSFSSPSRSPPSGGLSFPIPPASPMESYTPSVCVLRPDGRFRYAGSMLNLTMSILRDIFSVLKHWFYVPMLTKDAINAPTDKSIICSFTFDVDNQASFYARLFPGMELNCYRNIIIWVRTYSIEAAILLDQILPFKGPIVAIDMGLLLSSIVTQFDIKHMIIPTVTECHLSGIKFLHFDQNITENVILVIIKLLSFNGYVGAGGVDPMHMIGVAASVGASTIAANQASTLFRNSLDGMVEVKTILTEEEENWITRDRKHVNFTKSLDAGHDHPYLAACREIIRRDFDKMINLKITSLRTLILGASTREYREYNANAHICFQFANIESKDLDRTITNCLESLRNLKSKKITKRLSDKTALKRGTEDLKTITKAMKEWKDSRKVPERIILWEDTEEMKKKIKDHQFDILIFQDVGYNFTTKEWGEVFRMTGAVSALGYLCLPWELLQPDIVSPPGYSYRIQGSYSNLGYHGYSNGYVHKTKSWRTLMEKCALHFSDFNITIEFASRVGPMTLVRLIRTNTTENIIRHLEIPDYLKTTSILDVSASFDNRHLEIRLHNLKYFGVRSSEFNEAVNYGLDIAKESMNYNNILLFIRRRSSGISLVTKQLSKSWSVPPARISGFALVVYLYVLHLCKDFIKFQELATDTNFAPFKQILRRRLAFIKTTIRAIYDFFSQNGIFELLIKDVQHEFWQESVLKRFSNNKETMVYTGTGPEDHFEDKFRIKEDDEDDDFTNCYFCGELKEVSGEQLFTCQRDREEDFFHNFSLSNSELTHLRTTLADTSKDPIGLKTVKEDALRHTPLSVFDTRVRVKYICGPPGTGKSYIIRALATKQDLILAPFSRLRDDYTNFIHPITKVKTTLKFHTQHTGFSALNHSRIFVDEFTAMPYESLAVIVNNCGVDEVILVGDHRQTGLIHGIEGISIDSKIDLTKVRAHELVKNFRNPSDCVNVLNFAYGYRMLATNDNKGFSFDITENFNNYPDHTPLFFKHTTASLFGLSIDAGDKVTVRANQGATFDNVKLVITGADHNIFNMTSMAIVALSRHRNQCVILMQDSTVTAGLRGVILSAIDQTIVKIPDHISPVFNNQDRAERLGNVSQDIPILEEIDDSENKDKEDKDKEEEEDKDETNNNNGGGPPPPGGDGNPPPNGGTGPSTGGTKSTKDNEAAPSKDGEGPNKDGSKSPNNKGDKPTDDEKQLNRSEQETSLGSDNNTNNIKNNQVSNVNETNSTLNTTIVTEIINKNTNVIDNTVNILFGTIDTSQLNITLPIIPRYNSLDLNKRVNIQNTPNDSTCLLSCISLVTSNTINIVWKSMLFAIGNKRAYKIFNKPLSTNELKSFCLLNRIRIDINSRLISTTCGIEGPKIGPINHIPSNTGHFSVSQNVVIIKTNLILTQKQLSKQIQKDLDNSFWGEKFLIVEKQFLNLTIIDKLDSLRNVNEQLKENTDLINSINALLLNFKPLKHLTVSEICKLFSTLNIDNENIYLVLSVIYLSKNNRFWNSLKQKLLIVHPPIVKLVGGSDIQVLSLPKLNVVTCKEAPPEPLLNVDDSFIEMARLYTNPIHLRGLLVDVVVDDVHQIVRIEQSSFDSFKMLIQDFMTTDENNFCLTNQESISYIDEEFGTGKFDMTTLDNLNIRGHPKRTFESAWCLLNVAPGITYFGNNLSQSLHCLQSRYLTKAYVTIFNNESLNKARNIADLFFDEHMQENFDIFNEQDLFKTVHESEHSMKIKNYDKQTSFDLFGDADVRFSMKDIFKPIKSKLDLFKAGQGISAWSKDMQTIFQSGFRLINKHFINSLKDHVVYDNGIDEFTLMTRVNALFDLLPSTAINGVIDATACDSGQNKFTQMIERRILERLNISDDFLDWYYENREKYTLKGYGIIAEIKDIKTSGEPATLLNNTILMACLMNYILRGEGPVIMVIKGDDGLKRQANMVHKHSITGELKKFLKMEFKVDIDIPMTFCGYFLNGSNLIPDILRKVFKILGHRFRDYEHFCQYQQSLRDWILVINKLGITHVCDITANSYELTFEYCYSLFHSIVSLTHINEKQFTKIFTLRQINLKEDFVSTKPWTEKVNWYKGDN